MPYATYQFQAPANEQVDHRAAKAVKLYVEHELRVSVIAERLSAHKSTVLGWLREAGVKTVNRRW